MDGAQGLLHSSGKGQNTRVILTRIDSASKTDPYDAMKHIQAQGVERKKMPCHPPRDTTAAL